MTQPPPLPPETLAYQTPNPGALRPTRKKAVQHARGNGVGCLVLSLCFSTAILAFVRQVDQAGPTPGVLLVGMLVSLYTLAFLVCGILYVIGSIMIRKPNARWEQLITVTASIHIGIVVLQLVGGVLNAGMQGDFPPAMLIGVVVNLVIAIALVQMIMLIRKMHALGE